MIANAGLVIRPVVGVLFLISGIILYRRSRAGGLLITLGSVLFLGAELYGLVVLRPFVGRSFDEAWHEQLSTVDAVATVGLLLNAIGLFIQSRKT
jgi:hypothetical protein